MTTATPIYQVLANGADITATLQGRLLDLSITDNRGFESDSLVLNLDDTDAGIKWPKRGAELQVWIGYQGEALHYHGKYTVDELTHSGVPDKLSINCKAADILAQFKGAKTRSFDKTTLGAILTTLASDNQLTPAISATLASNAIDHIDQTNESDLNFLTRLGDRYGAVAKIADGKLLFTEAGKATSASGKPLPTVLIDRNQVDSHAYTEAGRGDYSGVEAGWHDIRLSKRKLAKTGAKGMIVSDEETVAGSSDNVKRLKQTFPDEATAKAAAEAEWQRLQRAKTTLELDIKHGMPGLTAETKIIVSGFPPSRAVLMGEWVATEVMHALSGGSGLSSRVKLERLDDYIANE